MRKHRLLGLFLIVLPSLQGADPFFFGNWKIASAVLAPWADPAVRKPDATEMNSLVGKPVAFLAKEITGPRQVACKGPKYTLKDYPADMLFQGMFGEMHEKNNSVDPAKLAAGLGFKGNSWKTLETGCGMEIDWHFIDQTTAAFGLNDYVYILKKEYL